MNQVWCITLAQFASAARYSFHKRRCSRLEAWIFRLALGTSENRVDVLQGGLAARRGTPDGMLPSSAGGDVVDAIARIVDRRPDHIAEKDRRQGDRAADKCEDQRIFGRARAGLAPPEFLHPGHRTILLHTGRPPSGSRDPG